jgi:peptide/nickel transport system permease protein
MTRLLNNRALLLGAALVLAIAALAAFAGPLAPYDPLRSAVRQRLRPPDALHWFGTDHFGRDILSRMLYGARTSLIIGFATAVLTGLFGTIIGAAAGFISALDHPIMRLMDALMAFPAILLAIAVAAVLGASVPNVIIALSVATTPHTARIVRASVLVIRRMDYVEAARAIGAGQLRILLRHVLPNAAGPLIVRLTYVFALAILAEAALSFIGVGPPPPAPTFGNIIANGRDFIADAPWITIFPGLAVIASVLGLNLLGDGLRDILDPRTR